MNLGEYRACDHDFQVKSNATQIDGHPDTEPLDPFLSRLPPDISWTGMESSDSTIILLVDAGFGLLKYLVSDYPHEPRILKQYETIDNFRLSQPTPLVLLVFRASPLSINSLLSGNLDTDRIFDLTAFMMEHHLEDGNLCLHRLVYKNVCRFNWVKLGNDRLRCLCYGKTTLERIGGQLPLPDSKE